MEPGTWFQEGDHSTETVLLQLITDFSYANGAGRVRLFDLLDTSADQCNSEPPVNRNC